MKTKLFFIGMLLSGVSMVGQERISLVTVGVGVGGNHLFKDVYDYSLTTDGTHKLKIIETNKNNFVISPVIAFRFGNSIKKENSTKFYKIVNASKGKKFKELVDNDLTEESFKSSSRFSLLLSLNLLDIKSNEIGFNKTIDGGIGIGYAFATNLQIGLFYEIKNYRQMRPYIVETYKDTSIPLGATEFYNALDKTDNSLFYDKAMEGLSVKLIFNVNSL